MYLPEVGKEYILIKPVSVFCDDANNWDVFVCEFYYPEARTVVVRTVGIKPPNENFTQSFSLSYVTFSDHFIPKERMLNNISLFRSL